MVCSQGRTRRGDSRQGINWENKSRGVTKTPERDTRETRSNGVETLIVWDGAGKTKPRRTRAGGQSQGQAQVVQRAGAAGAAGAGLCGRVEVVGGWRWRRTESSSGTAGCSRSFAVCRRTWCRIWEHTKICGVGVEGACGGGMVWASVGRWAGGQAWRTRPSRPNKSKRRKSQGEVDESMRIVYCDE